MALEVGLLLELLDVVPIAARVDLPVERGQIVAGQVLAVLGELDAEPLIGLRCRPARKPSTTVRAFSSIVPSRAMTAGSRNRRSRGGRGGAIGYIPLCGSRHGLEQALDERVGVTRSDSA